MVAVRPPWARPDQIVCAVLAFDQAGIDRCRERRIVKGHGHIRASGLTGLLPRCADVVASRLQAVVGCAFVVTLVVGNQLDLDVERQGAELAGEAFFVCGEGADVSHDDFSFRVEQGRASASLL